MTIRAYLSDHLLANGLFPEEAEAIVTALVTLDSPMRGRWNEDTSGYPPQLMSALILAVDTEAVKWIDANCPRHWARPLFAGAAA